MSSNSFSFPWLVNAKYDLTFFSGSVLISPILFSIYYGLSQFYPKSVYPALLVYFIYVVIFDFPHVMQTFSRTHKDQAEFQRHKTRIQGALILIVLMTLVATLTEQYAFYYRLINLYGIWHLLRQNLGFIRAYNHKNKDFNPIVSWIEEGVYYCVVAHLFFHNSESYEFFDSLGTVLSVQVQSWGAYVEQFFFFLFLSFLGAFLCIQGWKLRRGESLNVPKLIFVGVTVANYCFYGMVQMPLLVFLALETSYHDIQYHGFIMHYQKKRYPKEKNVVRKWLIRSLLFGVIGGVFEYYGRFEDMGSMEESVAWADMPFAIFVLYHYYIDGVIWKFRESPELRQIFTNTETAKA